MKQFFLEKTKAKAVAITIAMLSGFIVFKERLELLANNFLVSPLLSYIRSDWPTDLAFFTLASLSIFVFIDKLVKKTYVSPKNLSFLIIFFFILFWYRGFDKTWVFTSFFLISNLKYFDIAFLAIGLSITLMLVSFLRKTSDSKTGFIREDSPIKENSEDLLGYSQYADRIATVLQGNSFKGSFALGITGEWGHGKTSFLNLIKKNLKNSGAIVVDFNAWDSTTPQNIIVDFFDTFSAAISSYHTEASELLIRYSQSLANADESFWGKFFKSVFPDSGLRSLETQKQRIATALPLLRRRVYVCIDDLDRLDSAEVIEVIRLIRNTASFPNVVFLACYDRNYVIKALKTAKRYSSENFLEKIFQREISLPYYEPSEVIKALEKELMEKMGQIYHAEIPSVIAHRAGKSPLEENIKTLRDVKKLINIICFDFDLLKAEVDVSDFLNLAILRLKHPFVYELLYRRTKEFLKISEGLPINITMILITNQQNELHIIGYLKENLKNLPIIADDLERIKGILLNLFPSRSGWDSGQNLLSIRFPQNFDRYFAFRLLSRNLSEQDFQNAISSDQRTFHNYIKSVVQQGLHNELKYRFNRIQRFENREFFEKIIDGIFFLAIQKRVTENEHAEHVGYDAIDLSTKLSNSHRRLEKLYRGRIVMMQGYIIGKFRSANSPFLVEASLASEVRNLMIDEEYGIAKSQLDEILLNYLTEYLASIQKLDTSAWFLYQCCIVKNWQKDSSRNYVSAKRVIKGANEAFISFLTIKDLRGFLQAVVDRRGFFEEDSGSKNLASISPICQTLFGSWDSFEEFLRVKESEGIDYVSEFVTFFKKCKENGFAENVEFRFEKLFDNPAIQDSL